DALMLVGLQHDPALLERLRGRGIPHVLCWAHDPAGRLPCVGFDNCRAAAAMARHLIGLGHRRIAMIAGLTRGNDRARDRVDGVRMALEEIGENLAPEAVIEVPYSYAEGRAAMKHLLARATRPSAVICGNDVLAIGAVLAARDAGLEVPGEISVSGFDDLPLAGEFAPALTTMRVPAEAMGEQAASYLVARLEGGPAMASGPIPPLTVELVVRNTTGAAP
ncbi:MAG: substrate-binding domain-containing protein, partial [Rhodospirillales bacterium]